MTSAELAAKIKAKYPEYASIPDAELVTKITTKYPEYKSQLTEATPPPPTKLQGTGTGTTPSSDTGLVGGFLQTSPLNPKNLFGLVQGAYAPTLAAGKQIVADATGGNLLGAGMGALDLLKGGPATRAMITDPMMQHAQGAAQAVADRDPLKAAEQLAGAIPGNAGTLALGQQNAGNLPALMGNLAGIFTAPRATKAAGDVAGAGGRAAGGVADAIKATPQAQAVSSGVGRAVDAVKASTTPKAMNGAASTAIITGGITMNPFAGLAAGAADLLRRIVPEAVERWNNQGATLLEIRAAAKKAEKAATDNIKYRGVSKQEFGQIQDHFKALEFEAETAAKAQKAELNLAKQTRKVEDRVVKADLKRGVGEPAAPVPAPVPAPGPGGSTTAMPSPMATSGLQPAPVSPVTGPLSTSPRTPAPPPRPNLADPAEFKRIMETVKPRGTLAESPRGAPDIASAVERVVEKLHKQGKPTGDIVAAVGGIPEIGPQYATQLVQMTMKGLKLADNPVPTAAAETGLMDALVRSQKGRGSVGETARAWIAQYNASDAGGRARLIRGLGGKLNFEDMRQLAASTDDLR